MGSEKKSPYGFDLTDFVPFFFQNNIICMYNKLIRPPVTRTGKQIFLKYVKSLFKITKICCEGIHNNTFSTSKKYFKDIKFGQTAGVQGISRKKASPK